MFPNIPLEKLGNPNSVVAFGVFQLLPLARKSGRISHLRFTVSFRRSTEDIR